MSGKQQETKTGYFRKHGSTFLTASLAFRNGLERREMMGHLVQIPERGGI